MYVQRMSRPISRRAEPNRSTKRRHGTTAQCESGICRACKWNVRRVPRAWLTERAGTPYPCKSKVIGRKVRLRGDPADSEVVGCATPLGETIFQHGRRARSYKCQGAFIVRSGTGRSAIETPVPKSVVRARMRHAGDVLCPDTPSFDRKMAGYTRSIEREAAKAKKHPYDYADEVPFPHRKGSTPCCVNSPIRPERLDALLRAWRESGEESDFDALATAVRRALPKHIRATTELESRAQIERGIKAVRDHCWSFWLEREARLGEGSKSFRRRVREDRKAMAVAELPITRGQRKRGVSRDSADVGGFLRRADLVSSSQFERRSPDEQRRIVARVFKRARKSIETFNPALHEGRELLEIAARELSRDERVRRW